MMQFLLPENYQPVCQQRFDLYQQKICKILPSAKVEHIGSSSIPNAISKGDLDIYVEIKPELLESAIEQLKALNFSEKLNTLRKADLCMLESNNGDDVAIQIVSSNSEFTNFLTFRDRLINSPSLVTEYNLLKSTCSGLDQDRYRSIKSQFIQKVLQLESISKMTQI